MKYELYFITSEFKELIDEKVLKFMLEIKEDDFYKKQISYFFLNPKKEEVYNLLKTKLKDREDVIIDDDIVIFKNQITGESAKLIYTSDNRFCIHCNDRHNPLLIALISKFNVLLYEI
ncbi:MAG: hypothetical protein J1F31_02150 [Erysipelotrichales bacterium]|nr:hypothetical protein [Erysipelotrichales bacterium]